MNKRNKIIAGFAAVALAVGLGSLAAAPAQAVWGNKVVNYRSDCLTLRDDGGYNFNICGANSYAFHVSHVVVPRAQCRQIGTWSFRTYCASGKVALLVPVGSGTHYVR